MAEKIREHIKSVILIILFGLMILFAALYFVGTQSAIISPDIEMPLDRLLIIKKSDSESSLTSLDRSDYLPEMVAYCVSGEGGALTANRDLMRDFADLFEEYYSRFFSSEAVCTDTSAKEGEDLWRAVIDGGSYLYIRYPGELPYPLIYAFYTETNTASHAEGKVAFVLELLIDLEGSRALSRSGEGEYARYTPAPAEKAGEMNLSALSAYDGNKSFSSFRMTTVEDAGYAVGIPILEGEFSANRLTMELCDPTKLFAGQDERNRLLKLFDFNPDNPRSYDDNGSTVYIEEHGALTLSPEGSIGYEASDARSGIPLANILGYSSYDGEYTMSEAMTAACGLSGRLTELSSGIGGSAAELQLVRVAPDESREGVCFVFSYFSGNIRIDVGSNMPDDALRVTVCEGCITSVSLVTLSFTDTLIAELLLPLTWLEEHLFDLASIPNTKGRCVLVYSVITGESESRQIGCGWNYVRKKS